MLLCWSVVRMVTILTVASVKRRLFKNGALTWGLMGRVGGRGIRRFRSVSDAEWHSELLHSSQPASAKQASCCFYPFLHLLVSVTQWTLALRWTPLTSKITKKSTLSYLSSTFSFQILLPFIPRNSQKEQAFQLGGKIVIQYPLNIVSPLLQYYQHCCALQSLIHLGA